MYAVTDVCRHGAATRTLRDRDEAMSIYALARAEPATLYAQVTDNGVIIRQFVRHAYPSVVKLETEK